MLCGVSSQPLLPPPFPPGLERRGPVCEQTRGRGQEVQSILFANESRQERAGPGRAAPVSALLSMWCGDYFKCTDYSKEKPITVVNGPKGGNRAEREARMTVGLPTWWMVVGGPSAESHRH